MTAVRVLVVDDDAIVLDSCRRVLGAEGFVVRSVPGAEEGLQALLEESWDLLIVDVKMPVHDGFWLVARAREIDPGLRIVVMSGYSTRETEAAGRRVGAHGFIAKPFLPDELLATVRESMCPASARGGDGT